MPRTTSWTLWVLLTLGLSAVVWVNWPTAAFTFPALSSADIANVTGAPGDNYRLRVHLTKVRYTSMMKPWTDLKEPARSLWAILSFEDIAANGGGVSKYRFQLDQDPTMPTLENIADAYHSLGATRLAAWLASTRQHADEIARGLP